MIIGLTCISEECFSFHVNVSARIKLHSQFRGHFATRRALEEHLGTWALRELKALRHPAIEGTWELEALYLADSNPVSNDVTPATSTSTILDDCTQQESIPDASTAKNQKPSPKQDELYVAIGDEKDILLLLYKKRDHKLVTQEDRKELKSCEKG